MFSGSMITLNIHSINEGSKEEKPDEAKVRAREKEKEKAEVAEDFSDQDSKAEAKYQPGRCRKHIRSHHGHKGKSQKAAWWSRTAACLAANRLKPKAGEPNQSQGKEGVRAKRHPKTV